MKRLLLGLVLVAAMFIPTAGVATPRGDGECTGNCSNVYVGGCTFICQQYVCQYPGGIVIEYSVTTAICGDEYYIFPPDYGYSCPCRQ